MEEYRKEFVKKNPGSMKLWKYYEIHHWEYFEKKLHNYSEEILGRILVGFLKKNLKYRNKSQKKKKKQRKSLKNPVATEIFQHSSRILP